MDTLENSSDNKVENNVDTARKVSNLRMVSRSDFVGQTDVLILRMLIDYMADGLVGPFQVMPVEPTTMQKISGSKGKTYIITGPDYRNRLKLEFNEINIASDICYALNRAYGFEALEGWIRHQDKQGIDEDA